MCGIVGIIDLHDTLSDCVEESILLNMTQSLKHRGPDHLGIWISGDRKIGLGHTRLKIIDLSDSANQPMCNEDGTVWITFNGEIYNYREVKSELIKKGHRFKTDSDTEVIIHAYEEWGIECLKRFEGMFAFGLYDQKQKEFYLARDRVGKKPVYYTVLKGTLIFSSEIKSLLRHPRTERKLNVIGLYHFFTFGYFPPPLSPFADIYKLPSAHYLHLTPEGPTFVKYFEPSLENLDTMNEEILVDKLEYLLKQSIKRRLVADVPIGVFFSGGLDSSLITKLIINQNYRLSDVFTLNYEDEKFRPQDLEHAEKFCKRNGLKIHKIGIKQNDVLQSLDRILSHHDDLNTDSLIPFYFLSKIAHELDYKVIITGEGADELFCGYAYLGTLYKMLKLVKKYDRIIFNKSIYSILSGLFSLLDKPFPREILEMGKSGYDLFWGSDVNFSESEKRVIFNSEVFRGVDSYDFISKVNDSYIQNVNNKDGNYTLSRWSYFEVNQRLSEYILQRVDKTSMQFSVECRSPFLDTDVINFSLSLEDKFKINKNLTKYILKKLSLKYFDASYVFRKKVNLSSNIPYFNIFLDNREYINETVFHSKLAKEGILDYSCIHKIFQRKNNYFNTRKWLIFVFSRWYNFWF